ncbi:MAG: serine/threonine protein kinase [Proteobacteria bacterium]|nr:serine/threonine protein kinase [Pseudomonadota bacterium]
MAQPQFADLGPDAALDAVEAAGLRPTGHCAMLRCLENRVWDLRLEDESHVVLKFYRPGRWSRAGIEDEHRFLLDLRASEIPVCAPLALPGGGTIGEHLGIHFGVWPRTGGREPDELTDEEVTGLGRLLARIHNVGATQRPQDRPVLDSDTALIDPLDELLAGSWLPASCEERYATAVESLADVYCDRLAEVPLLRIHGDCHLGNLLRGREGWFFLEISSWIARRWKESSFQSTFPHFGTELYWQNETRDLEELVLRLDEPEPE